MGVLGCVASVMNAVIGTGILALPVAFSRTGWGLGTGAPPSSSPVPLAPFPLGLQLLLGNARARAN